jgi:hypothetical protein
MSTITIKMPESLAHQIREWAAREGVSVDQLFSSAPAEKLSALMTVDQLRERARRAKREDFVDFLSRPLTCRRLLAMRCDAAMTSSPRALMSTLRPPSLLSKNQCVRKFVP